MPIEVPKKLVDNTTPPHPGIQNSSRKNPFIPAPVAVEPLSGRASAEYLPFSLDPRAAVRIPPLIVAIAVATAMNSDNCTLGMPVLPEETLKLQARQDVPWRSAAVMILTGSGQGAKDSLLLQVVVLLVALVAGLLLLLAWKQRKTRTLLESCGLPTVVWRPKFVNYVPNLDDDTASTVKRKLASSNITNILPRMERLGGPHGMYGTVYGISTAVVHVAHPVPAKAILMKTTFSQKAPAYNHFKNFCGDGVFTADGREWKEKRASLMHCLLKGCTNPKAEAAARLEAEANHAATVFLKSIAEEQKRQDGPINVVPFLQRATVGLIYRFITHDTEAAILENRAAASKTPGLLASYMQSILHIRMIILAQSRSVWYLLPRWCYRYFSSMFQQEERTMQPIREFARYACQHAQPNSPLARLQERPSHQTSNTTATKINKHMLDEAITLLFAGQDTSAATLSWTLHLLSLHPHVQTKLVKEVCQVLNGSDHVTRKHISQMPYLDAVIKESMRLYPVAPFVVRKLPQAVTIPGDDATTTRLPSHTLACIWIYGLHRNPKFWNRPNEFLPERWIDPALRDAGIQEGAYMPFAAGPRNCVGQPLAHVILRTLLARLISALECRDDRLAQDSANVDHLRKDMQAGFTVLPQGGVPLSLEFRRHAKMSEETSR